MATPKLKRQVAETFLAKNTSEYEPHPLADFVPGRLSDPEFDTLCDRIRAVGLLEPIALYEGKILDGRQRYRACRQVGIAPKFIEFKGSETEAEEFVMDKNMRRKSITRLHKAMVAARLNMRNEAAMSQKDAAKHCGVGVDLVNLMVRLLRSGNTPLIKRTEADEATVEELKEVLYEREAAMQHAHCATSAAMFGSDDDEADDDGDAMPPTIPGNVVSLPSAAASVGKRPTHPERKARATPAHEVAQAYLKLDDANRRAFVDLAWPKLVTLVAAKLK